VLQPITGFRTGWIGGPALDTGYNATVSYGIRRREFDDYLLRRSGARLIEGVALASLQRENGGWIVNGLTNRASGGGRGRTFLSGGQADGRETGARERGGGARGRVRDGRAAAGGCRVRPDTPELYFCADIKGYGWCFRKQNYLNIGLGRMDQHRLSEHVAAFVRFLKSAGRISFDVPSALLGHAYLTVWSLGAQGGRRRRFVDRGRGGPGLQAERRGDSAGHRIGLLAAQAITRRRGLLAGGSRRLRKLLARRFGATSGRTGLRGLAEHLPERPGSAPLGRRLLGARWFVRDVS
jgi:hypothetical protein